MIFKIFSLSYRSKILKILPTFNQADLGILSFGKEISNVIQLVVTRIKEA